MVAAGSSAEAKLPITTAQLIAFLSTFQHDESGIRHDLIPMLDGLARSGPKGEAVLSALDRAGAEDDPLEIYMKAEVTSDEIKPKTVELVYMLSARLAQPPAEATHSIKSMTLARNLAARGDRRLFELILPRLGTLAIGIVDLAVHLGQPVLAKEPLEDLMACLPQNRYPLSGVHSAYLELCLITRDYEPAVQIINRPILEIYDTKPTYVEILTFYHHAGLICAALKNWRKAREMFEVCLILPGHAVSAIQIAAAKRAILCELLSSGKSLSFPRQASGSFGRAFEKNGSLYSRLANAFGSARWSEVNHILKVEAEQGDRGVFVNDANLGLVNQVAAAIPRRKIWRLTQTYSRMSLADLAQQIGYTGKEAEVETMLNEMINNDRPPLRAELSNHSSPSSAASTRIVTFSRSASAEDAASQGQEINSLNQTSAWWERVLADRSKQLGLDRKWLKKQAARIEMSESSGLGPAEVAGEEDVMSKKGVRGAGADWNDVGF